MTPSRILLAACLTLLLTACGDEHKDKAPSPPPPVQPAGESAPKPAAEQPRESEAAPAAAETVASAKAPAVEAATKPAAKASSTSEPKPESRHVGKDQPKARTAKKAAVDPIVKRPLPPVKLDLRLPKDLVQQLHPDKPVPELEDKPLLPPMFVEKTGQSPFQVGGRLIQRERNERESNDDSWHSEIRGAELQFQFRN